MLKELLKLMTTTHLAKLTSMKEQSNSRFRSSPIWRDHRLQMLDIADYSCQCCGVKYNHSQASKLQVHHRDLNKKNYLKIEDKSRFSVLCGDCHKFVHRIHNRLKKKKGTFAGALLLYELDEAFFL
jgi:predicted HNH restriction endonuclease